MGRHVEVVGFGTSFSGESGRVFTKVTGDGGAFVFSPEFNYTGVGGFTLTADLGVSGVLRDSAVVTVEVYCRKTAGAGDIVIQIRSAYSFSQPSL
jgi:hypothetical protein